MKKPYSSQEMEFLKNLGSRIKALRARSGLSQEKLAFACELDRTYIGSVERGERNISVINLNKIANSLNVSPSDLLNLKE